VITFLGHVDHGKTSLLDRIIGIDVVSGESGGITQHIRAYSIEKGKRRISFVDTPGHEAFTEMRARGANVTDIAVLVVAADDGVMPQTEEAISHARAAEVPIVVALNKIDLPGVNVDRVYQGLSTNELLPSEWGGDVEVVKTSATKGTGIDELLETLLTVAELHEYKANPNRPAVGTCLEAQQEADRGIVAKVLVQNGTLHVGDVVVCGQAHGRVKAMYDTLDEGRRVTEAGPSIPVNITGLDVAPSAGSRFYVLDDIARAREIAHDRAEHERAAMLGATGFHHVTLENLFDRLEHSSEVQTLNIILRADVRGSIEAIEKEFSKLEHPEVRIKLLQRSVGGITEADVTLAHASDAIIIGFNVVPDEKARTLAEQTGVQIRRYDVIYKITDDLRLALEGMLKPEEREVELGRALVQQVFKISRVGTVAGCRVLSGTVERSSRARVIRDSTIIGDYALDTLRREKDDAKEVREGYECGIKLAGFNDVKEGDLFEVYKVEEVHRTFNS
jgi:translation initiation factor IF-2